MKNKVKKIFNNKIFTFILGGIVFSSISVIAATYFPSGDVTYDNTASGLQSTNVQGAIDELYNSCSKTITSDNYIYFLVNSGSIYGLNLENNELKAVFNNYGTEIEGSSIKDFFVTSDYIYLMVDDIWQPVYRFRLDNNELKIVFNNYGTEIERKIIDGIFVK